MDCNLPGSSVHEILQARILEWVAISFLFCLLHLLEGSLPLTPPGKPEQSEKFDIFNKELENMENTQR